jgi:membrane-bound ClpP family serine protease
VSSKGVEAMIILGAILLIAGFLLKLHILWVIGIIMLVVGAVLAIMGRTGRAVGGRRHYF